MPGMGDDMEGAMQQAPHFGRQFIGVVWHIVGVVAWLVFLKSKSKSRSKAWVPVHQVIFFSIIVSSSGIRFRLYGDSLFCQ